MKREMLKELGLEDEAINQIMAENGKDIEKAKSAFADYEDIKSQLENANKKIESFGDVDAIKSEVQKYKEELKKAQEESEAKIQKMERLAQIKDFTSSKKFVNDFTRDSINSLLESEMIKEENKKKNLDELFSAITEGKENIFQSEAKAPTPPTVAKMNNSEEPKSDDSAIRAVMGLAPKN